jgi:hypothetical protein
VAAVAAAVVVVVAEPRVLHLAVALPRLLVHLQPVHLRQLLAAAVVARVAAVVVAVAVVDWRLSLAK